MSKSKMLHCKWCDFACLRWRRQKNGKLKDGYDTLTNHVENYHEDEYDAIIGWVADESASNKRQRRAS